MLVTLGGMMTVLRFMQSMNAPKFSVVTVLGIETALRAVHDSIERVIVATHQGYAEVSMDELRKNRAVRLGSTIR
jgi:hypothetical protein